MVRRLPSTPPVLPGFTYMHVLGSGGFADVFLYEQNMPRRQVAVKVLLSEVVDDHVRRMFQAEANVMAQLSAHPSILTVFQASVAGDGRPYIAMEFCSARLHDRYRSERMPVREVLSIAVKIGGALETAHRAGVLHRDIKPSNILQTAYGHPVLSDFGIASTLGETESHAAVGMSIPWSAPEVLADETGGTVASEVWSYAATVYSLLAGRSPFEIPDAANKPGELVSRIARAKAQPIGRADVPDDLERVLLAAMSRNPDARPATVLELVHDLQRIEEELGGPVTEAEIAVDDWARPSVSALEEQTVQRSAVGVAPPRTRARRRRSGAVPPAQEGGTVLRRTTAPGRTPAPGARRPGILVAVLTGLVALLIAGGVVLALTVTGTSRDDIPRVADITTVAGDGSVMFSWEDPGIRSTDAYQITVDDDPPSLQTDPTFTVASDGEPARTCVTVAVNRDGLIGESSPRKCADVAP
jgi:tRNA A-37 threonylcarbamoyl transferase component Bud32